MEFNTLVKAHLSPIFQKYGFEIAEEMKNIVRFQSSIMKVNLVFNDYDKSHFLEIGRQGEILYPLNDNVVKELWGSSALPIEQVTLKTFVQNLSLIFETKEGAEILKGNIGLLKDILNQESEKYTSELMQKQALEAASKAWEAMDYLAFVENINKIEIDKIPQSYQLKYKIAKQKL